jgi:ATP adenylyltransferase/5',5'''-P-1,P-4-tetraphosphate phosphorylase II
LWKFCIPSLVNCASTVYITKAGQLEFVPHCCKNRWQNIIAQCNLVVTRHVHDAEGRETAASLTTVYWQLNEWQPLVFIPNVCWFQVFH